jgi:hypothetical protein
MQPKGRLELKLVKQVDGVTVEACVVRRLLGSWNYIGHEAILQSRLHHPCKLRLLEGLERGAPLNIFKTVSYKQSDGVGRRLVQGSFLSGRPTLHLQGFGRSKSTPPNRSLHAHGRGTLIEES